MIQTDVLVIGAGPAGLFQAFQLGLLGLRVQVVDALPEAGGQCVALYPDKPIYDVPGIPVCTGRQLSQQLLEQIRPFVRLGESLHLGVRVDHVVAKTGGGYEVRTHDGQAFSTSAIVVAAGAGAFTPKGLNLPGLDEGTSHLHYHLPAEEAMASWRGEQVLVAGGGDEALEAAEQLIKLPESHRPSRVTLMHRRDVFQAEAELVERIKAYIASGELGWVQGVPQEALITEGRVHGLALVNADGTHTVTFDHLLVRQGMSPKLGPLTDWGMALDRKQVLVNPVTFQSSLDGVYAVGDINTYPGKKRLLVCAFHEATMAAHALQAYLKPDESQLLQYTTTSTLLKQRLGVL